MFKSEPRYPKGEFARRGQAIYERDILPNLQVESNGKFVAIDIESGNCAVHSDDFTATERLLSENPDAQIWLIRVGHRATYRIGGSRCDLDTNNRIDGGGVKIEPSLIG